MIIHKTPSILFWLHENDTFNYLNTCLPGQVEVAWRRPEHSWPI